MFNCTALVYIYINTQTDGFEKYENAFEKLHIYLWIIIMKRKFSNMFMTLRFYVTPVS